MAKTTLISEMLKLHFGSKIVCTDGEDGDLVYVVFDPTTRRMTAIGVKQGRILGKTVHLPFDSIENAGSDGVRLRVSLAEVAAGSSGPVEGAQLDGRSSVELSGSTNRGTVQLVAVHPESGELAYIVAHNLRAGQDTLVRSEFVASLANGQVKVTIPQATLEVLPPYQPDSVLQREVERALFAVTALHVDLKGIVLRVLDGVLYIDGNISSKLRSDMVTDQALGVQGLLEIKNRLVADDVLQADLARALGDDPRTRDLPIGVYPRLGVVRLSGAVHNNGQKAAAEEIVRSFPGVRSVINSLVVDPRASLLRVMAEPEGGNAEDIVPGKWVRHTG
ncbi:MAG TPA: BON domain-containing protein [Ktedonobacteraceae bacterium]|nr:BON domain-containing protein [Ktedonobacteraceae bacterium]